MPASNLMQTEVDDEISPLCSQGEESGGNIHSGLMDRDSLSAVDGQVTGLDGSIKENAQIGHPWVMSAFASIEEHQQHVDLKLRELIVSSPKVELVEGEALCIDLSTVGATVAVRAEGDQIFIIVGSNLCPRDNMMKVNFDLATGWNSAPVTGLDLHPSL